jgi:hypothetical protein
MPVPVPIDTHVVVHDDVAERLGAPAEKDARRKLACTVPSAERESEARRPCTADIAVDSDPDSRRKEKTATIEVGDAALPFPSRAALGPVAEKALVGIVEVPFIDGERQRR